MSEELQKVSLLEQIRQISSRRRRIGALAFAIPLSGALGLALFLPKSYRSTAVVVVERTGVADDDVDARLSVLKSENLSRERLKALIERFHLYQGVGPQPSDELLIDQMQKDVGIDVDKEERNGRNVVVAVQVTFTANDPKVAAGVANELAAFYEREDLRMRQERAAQTRSKLQGQLTEARQRLDEQEARLKDYKMRHLSELPEQVGMHLSALEQLNLQIRASRIPSGSARPKQAAAVARAAVERARDERLDQLRELETRYTTAHPDVKRLRREITAMPFIPPTPFEAPSELIEPPEFAAVAAANSRAFADGIRQKVTDLRREAAVHEQGILNAPFRQQELEALLPDYVAARTRYQSLWEKVEIAQLWDPLHDDGRLRVLDVAVARDEAVAPSVPRVVAMGIALSLAGVVGMVVAVERMDTSFHTLDDLRSFSRVPVLASVPRLVTDTDKRRKARGARRFMAIILVLVAFVLAGSIYLSRHNESFVTWMRQGHA